MVVTSQYWSLVTANTTKMNPHMVEVVVVVVHQLCKNVPFSTYMLDLLDWASNYTTSWSEQSQLGGASLEEPASLQTY